MKIGDYIKIAWADNIYSGIITELTLENDYSIIEFKGKKGIKILTSLLKTDYVTIKEL